MKPDESGLQRPDVQFVCVTCGVEPEVRVETLTRVTLFCPNCRVEKVYGHGSSTGDSGSPKS